MGSVFNIYWYIILLKNAKRENRHENSPTVWSGLENTNKPTFWFIKFHLELSLKFSFSLLPYSHDSEINIFVKTKQFYEDAGKALLQKLIFIFLKGSKLTMAGHSSATWMLLYWFYWFWAAHFEHSNQKSVYISMSKT